MEGVLHITVIQGKDFPSRSKSGLSDPYCVFIVNGKRHRDTSSVKELTNNPKFDEYFTLTIRNSHEVKYEKRGDLVVEVWSWDRFLPDHFIGRVIIPLTDIPANEEIRKWYPLQSKPKFYHKVHGHLQLTLWIEWRPVKHSLNAFYRINQKIGAKLSQVGRVGAHYLGRRFLNIKNWGMRTTQIRGLMKQLKPPRYAYSKESILQVQARTHFTDEELELLYYAFRSFSYPKDHMDREVFCRVFPALKNKEPVILAVLNAFHYLPTDDIHFNAFVIGISDVIRGNQNERLNVVAQFFEKGGFVEKNHFHTLVESLLVISKAHHVDLAHLEHVFFGHEQKIQMPKFVSLLLAFETKEEKRYLLRRKSDVEKEGYGLTHCFGIFHYLYEAITDMLENVMEHSAVIIKPEKEGFLMKKSGSSWAKYWFCLRNGFLFYYRDPHDRTPARVLFLENRTFAIDLEPQIDSLVDVSFSFLIDAISPTADQALAKQNSNGNRGRSISLKHSSTSSLPPPVITRARSATTGSSPFLNPLSSSSSATYPPFPSLSASASSVTPSSSVPFFANPPNPLTASASLDNITTSSSSPSSNRSALGHSASVPNISVEPLFVKPLPPIPRSEPIRHTPIFSPPSVSSSPSSSPKSRPSSASSSRRSSRSSLPPIPSIPESPEEIFITPSAPYHPFSHPSSAFSTSAPVLPPSIYISSSPIPINSSGTSSASNSMPSLPNTLDSLNPKRFSNSYKPLPPLPSTPPAYDFMSAHNSSFLLPSPITSVRAVPLSTSPVPIPNSFSHSSSYSSTVTVNPLASAHTLTRPSSDTTSLSASSFSSSPSSTSSRASGSYRRRNSRSSASYPSPSANLSDEELADIRYKRAEKKKLNELVPGPSNAFQIRVGGYTMILAAQDSKHRAKWVERLQLHAQPRDAHPFESFAPPRPKSGAKYYIDGCDYMYDVADAIKSAREQIFITDWFLSPEIYLQRTPENMSCRLDHLLAEKAKAGIKIFIIIWSETKLALNLNSEGAKTTLEALHKNITVICHPILLMKWSHHQKTVVIDQDVAFLGGLDLCFGRFDTPAHPLEDTQYKMFPGKDYYNPARGGDFDGLDAPFKDLIERSSVPRMPWHDVSVRVDGYAARDVAKNFIQRWNHHRNDIQMVSPLLVPKTILWTHTDTKTCQILRSLSNWSGQAGDDTEASIHAAMIHNIKHARHFIYIENQYFISSTAGGKVKNEIGEALIERIRLAILEKRTKKLPYPNFRVVVVLPVHPEGTYKDSNSIRYIMKWQYDTISRGGTSIIERLQGEFPDEDIAEFISFYALRNYGVLDGNVVTEQIYVHTKLMIVDDRTVIIGSANINDRSLLGDRDSEIAVIIDDETLVPSKMRGQPYMACKFALSLRLDLWREHLGLSVDNTNTVMDPLTPETYDLIWRNTAKNNTHLYSQAFGLLEGDTVERVRDMKTSQHIPASLPTLQTLTMVQGHLIEYPLNFLFSSLGDSFNCTVDIMIAGDEVFQ